MAKKEFSKSILVLLALFVLAALLLAGVNAVTAPLIEANGASAQFEPLFAVMPEAQNFDVLYSAQDPAATTLVDVPETVTGIYSETSGLGYAITLSTSAGYTKEPIEMTLAVDAEGKISALEVTAYPESRDVGADYLSSYQGQDSALPDVGLVAGTTFSSAAIRNAVSDGFSALINNDLVGAGVKSDDQILLELLPQVYPGIANNGVGQYEEAEVNSGSILKAYKALNGSGFGFVLNDGSANYLGVWTLAGGAKILDLEGNTVDNAALLEEIKAYGAANAESLADKEIAKLQRMVSEGAEITALPLNIYNSVTGVYSILDSGAQFYGFVARSYGYSNLPMAVYYVLDVNGAIVSMNVDELIFYKDYFTDYTLDEPSYKEGFAGLTADSYTGEQALIAGATMSTGGMDTATKDVFAAFAAIA
ncbi:MAG: FMN-binding protein [Candidatus Limivicinus sp.]